MDRQYLELVGVFVKIVNFCRPPLTPRQPGSIKTSPQSQKVKSTEWRNRLVSW